MADILANLPPVNSQLPHEKQALDALFGSNAPPPQGSPRTYKIIAVAIILFCLLGNTYADAGVCMLPRCDSLLLSILVRSVIFAVLLVLITKFFL